MYSTRNIPQCNVIQAVPHVQCFVTDLNDVTKNDQIKHELRKWGHFKHSVKLMTILNILSKCGPSATNTTKMGMKKVFKPIYYLCNIFRKLYEKWMYIILFNNFLKNMILHITLENNCNKSY